MKWIAVLMAFLMFMPVITTVGTTFGTEISQPETMDMHQKIIIDEDDNKKKI